MIRNQQGNISRSLFSLNNLFSLAKWNIEIIIEHAIRQLIQKNLNSLTGLAQPKHTSLSQTQTRSPPQYPKNHKAFSAFSSNFNACGKGTQISFLNQRSANLSATF